jgi:hypothetical protein
MYRLLDAARMIGHFYNAGIDVDGDSSLGVQKCVFMLGVFSRGRI